MEYEFCASKVHSTKEHVTFNTTIAILYEPPELQQLLREARTIFFLPFIAIINAKGTTHIIYKSLII
jgi:hypothetical protein